jgi:glycosyltransferase involved in cell wall biosynthesis
LDRSIDRIIVKSSTMAPNVSQFFDRNVDIVPNGIDVNRFSPERERHQAVDAMRRNEREHVVLTVAALEERKGIQHVIRALPQLARIGLSVRYVVVGEGEHRRALEAVASECDVESRVDFVGAVTDVIPYYQLADLFVLLSYGEGFPNVLLEAWAMSLPVIVSHHPPYPSLVTKDLGFTIDESDTSCLVGVISDLLHHPEARAKMGRAGREHVRANYSWREIARRYMQLYRDWAN